MEPTEILTAELVPEATRDDRPVRWREWCVILALVVLADVTIYRGWGYTGWASFLAALPLLLLCGAPPLDARYARRWLGMLVSGLLLLLLAAKMVWCGWPLQVFLGITLAAAFGASLSGSVPTIGEVMAFFPRVILGGLLGLAAHLQSVRRPRWGVLRWGWLSLLLPLAALAAFSLLFLLANPDLWGSFRESLERTMRWLSSWFRGTFPPWVEVVFWCVSAWLAIGLLRPVLGAAATHAQAPPLKQVPVPATPSTFYAAARNTLVAVVVLFAVYLTFEFQTLWFRQFPDGFYYSGYAHQGAFWLTVALALATFMLSLIFRGAILTDPRVKSLRRFAWLWSLENILLALAVYHRLGIYIGFNGMTRMRVVGLLGITSVLVGFLFVLWKMARQRDLIWLLQRHLWTVSLAIYLYAVLPVDSLVMQYNVSRIMAGDPAPAVQITEHDVSAEGVLMLAPLLDCDDILVRHGIGAYLAERYQRAESQRRLRQARGWTAFQLADQMVYQQLGSLADRLAPYEDRTEREQTYQRFRDYAYQWY